MNHRFAWSAVLLPFFLGCSGPSEPEAGPSSATGPNDPHSFSRPEEVAVTHLNLDVTVNFETRRVEGRASLDLDNRSGAEALFLDTHGLDIRAVTLDPGGHPTSFQLGRNEQHLGRPLIVDIAADTRTVHVDYASSPDSAALQWLEPQLTAGGRHPFLLSQSQSIFARSWIPCQDTPGVRMTYEATVRVPPGLLALMSAENPTEIKPDGLYRFRMALPVPAYLLALAVGEMEFRSIGERTGVYAEPPVIDRAAWEFAETEQMLQLVESLYGPYRWGRYDLVVLPSSFPFGGMENPRLTFVTPTVLAGDRSLVSLVAHELAHSWSGNLVTNANWNDFWLNEGFTVYLERRIMEALHGRDYSEMLATLGRQDLEQAFSEESPDDTRLKIDLTGRHPDDGFTDVAYEKGYLFLRTLEERLGRENWDSFLREYFETFAFKPMTTERFLAYLRKQMLKGRTDEAKLEQELRIHDWVYFPRLPKGTPKNGSREFERVEAQLQAWSSGVAAGSLQTKDWTTHHWLHFLRGLPRPGESERIGDLDRTFGLSQSGNSEILHAWLMLAIDCKYEAAYPMLERFLTGMGRRKFLEPLYSSLSRTAEGRELALKIYRRARPGYHSLSVTAIDEVLGRPAEGS